MQSAKIPGLLTRPTATALTRTFVEVNIGSDLRLCHNYNDARPGKVVAYTYTYGNHGNRLTQTFATNDPAQSATPPVTTLNYTWEQESLKLCTVTIDNPTANGNNQAANPPPVPSCANKNGATIAYYYDYAGRRTAAITNTPGMTTTTYDYTPSGTLRQEQLTPAGGPTRTERIILDPLDQQLCKTSGGNNADCITPTGGVAPPSLTNSLFAGTPPAPPEPSRSSSTGPSPRRHSRDHPIRLRRRPHHLQRRVPRLRLPRQHHRQRPNVGSNTYSPYGETPNPTPFLGYRGEIHIDNLINLRARYYDPTTGIFLTRDLLDGINGTTTVANPYHYVSNDPINRTDPTGLRMSDSGFEPPAPSPMPCSAAHYTYPVAYFPSDSRERVARDYDTKEWYEKGDDKAFYVAAGLSAAAPSYVLPQASENDFHFLDDSGTDKMMKVDQMLGEIKEFRELVQGLVRAMRKSLPGAMSQPPVCDQYFETKWKGWTPPKTNLDWFLALGGFYFSVQAYASSTDQNMFRFEYRVVTCDLYRWNGNGGYNYFTYGPANRGLHTAGLAQQYMEYGSSSLHYVWVP